MTAATSPLGFKHPLPRMFLIGAIGGVIATLIQYIGAVAFSLPFPPAEIFRLILAPVSGSLQSVAVENLGEYAKYGAFTFATATYVLLYGLIGAIVCARPRMLSKVCALLSFIIPTIVALAFELDLAPSYSSLSSLAGWLLAAGVIFVANISFMGTFMELTNLEHQRMLTSPPHPATVVPRRGFLRKTVGLAFVVAAAAIGIKVGFSVLSGQPVVGTSNPIPVNPESATTMITSTAAASTSTVAATSTSSALAPIFADPRISHLVKSEVTDNRIFYRVDIDPDPPELDFDSWSLTIDGKVSNPKTIKKTDILSLPTMDEYVTLECISNTINPPAGLISNAKWTGVPLGTLLNQAGLLPEAKYIIFHSADGYRVGIPVERAMHPETILAYKMNDDFLRQDHGFPVRAIIPGIYGMMNAKWIIQITVVDYVYLGYWQTRGWSNDARIKTTSIIYYPSPQISGEYVNIGSEGSVPVAGVAFAGDRGISKVEVSTDGGKTWNQAYLKLPTSPYSWILWAYEWTPPGKGQYQLMVRATDGTGAQQSGAATNPFPYGATGYNSLNVNIT